MKMYDREGVATYLKCSHQQVSILVHKKKLKIHYPINRNLIKVGDELVQIPEHLIGIRRPKSIFFESDILEYLKNA